MIEIANQFNMVDMGGIDVVESQGVAVEGLFNRLLNAIQNCRYQILYNWKFAQVEIAPSPIELVFDGEKVYINDAITVTEDDVVHIYTPTIVVDANIVPLDVTENGTYEASGDVDGYNPIVVSIPTGSFITESNREPTIEDGSLGDYWLTTRPVEFDSVAIKATTVARGSDTSFNYYGTSAFRLVLEDGEGDQVNVTDLNNASLIIRSISLSTGGSTNATGALTAPVSGTYFERSGLPAYFVVSADDIDNYKPVSIGLCRRQSYVDYLVNFSVILVKDYEEVYTIKTVSGLTASDWPGGDIVMFTDLLPPIERKLFHKEESGWIQIL